MSLKSVLQKLKPKEKPQVKPKNASQEKSDAKPPEPNEATPIEKQEPKPVKEYHETLYTKEHTRKEKTPKTLPKQETQWKPKHGEGINTIEKNIDTIHTKEKYPKSSYDTTEETDIERKVDMIIKKKQR